jgi:hypothetical protein
MVPSGFWTQEKITNSTKAWNNIKANETHLTEILPAEHKPTDVYSVADNQTHLTTEECEKKLRNFLFDFQDLFQGTCGRYNGELAALELIPGSKPFYGKPFSIPKVYKQLTKDEIR